MNGYSIIVVEKVAQDLEDIAFYYEERYPGLGKGFYLAWTETLRDV